MQRRSFLRRSAASAVGASGGLAAVTAADEQPFGSVTVRGHFSVNPFLQTSLADGYTKYGFETQGEIPGYTTGPSPEELIIFPNAWDKSKADVDRRFPKYQDALARAGYEGESIVFEWSSKDNPALWYVTSAKARRAGKKLGQFIKEYRAANPDTTIRLIGFSLGAEVALSSIKSLVDRGWDGSLESLALLGAAVSDESLAMDDTYGPACQQVFDEIDNFYKTDDQTLSSVLKRAEANGVIGTDGIQGTPPANYEQHQVDYVTGHDYYWSYDDGCIQAVVDEWTDADG